ncbi:MAG: hypothetical protein EZS28_001098 [Streblomastix strix]|uniref:Uncharacterized protein n=1 Tax=Streblomastix strix TaxID=222440 RepID=A0A5J4X817_9EUKA|nr:MAG: hypothetical protein EZS28_001098 [Streblomastix strix]
MCPLSDLIKIGVIVRDVVVAEDAYLAGMPELFMVRQQPQIRHKLKDSRLNRQKELLIRKKKMQTKLQKNELKIGEFGILGPQRIKKEVERRYILHHPEQPPSLFPQQRKKEDLEQLLKKRDEKRQQFQQGEQQGILKGPVGREIQQIQQEEQETTEEEGDEKENVAPRKQKMRLSTISQQTQNSQCQ